MSALIGDVLDGAITPGVCNAAVNAGGKLLKVVDMQHRYGTTGPDGRELVLAAGADGGDEPGMVTAKRLAELERQLEALKSVNGRHKPR